jgi:hypothetical protein
MSDTLHLLETLGRDTRAELDALLRHHPLPPGVEAALQAGDAAALGRALGARAAMACSLAVPEREDEPVPQEDDGDAPEPEERAA